MTSIALAPLLLLASLAGAADAQDAPPSLPLEEALRELDGQSFTLAQARSRADEATALVRQARSALLPTAAAGVTYQRNRDEAVLQLPAAMGGRTIDMQPQESTTVSGTLRVPLLAPSAWFDLAQAHDAARAAELSAAAVRLATRTALAQSAHLAAAAEEQVQAAERAVQDADELVRSAARRVEAGTAAPLEVTRARAELVRRESDRVGARAALDRAQLAVGILLGREGAVRVIVPDVEAGPGPAQAPGTPEEALVAEALERRPELAAQRAQQDAAEAGIRSAWARLLPQLSASGTVFRADVPYVTGEKDGWKVSVDLTWQLYDGGYRYGKRDQAEAQARGARAGLEAERLAVRREVEDGRRDVAVAGERLRLARAQLALATDTAASIRRSFEAGVASSLDVIDGNDRLYLADTGLAEARARLAQARLALQLALGREG